MNFEGAVDAVVAGDREALESMLRASPELVLESSERPHGSTLLHYVAANGVEQERQRTPGNAVDIARVLLDAGADVNAKSESYGGGATVLGLVATSVHPERAGLQQALMKLLLSRGAVMETGLVNACLRNGRGKAAEFLASRGAPVDLEGAAGVGNLERVKALAAAAPEEQKKDGLLWACEFGHAPVVRYLLELGVPVRTGLHWAAYGGHKEIVEMLLSRGAPLDLRDSRFQATPLEWARHAAQEFAEPSRFDEVAELLA